MMPLSTNWPPGLQQVAVRYLLHGLGNSTAALSGLVKLAEMEATSSGATNEYLADWSTVVGQLSAILAQLRVVVPPGTVSNKVCDLGELVAVATQATAAQESWTLTQALDATGTIPLPPDELKFLFQQTLEDARSQTGKLSLLTKPPGPGSRVRCLVPGEFVAALWIEWNHPLAPSPANQRSTPAPPGSLIIWRALAHTTFGAFEIAEHGDQRNCLVCLPVRPTNAVTT